MGTIRDNKYSVSGKLSTNSDMNYTELVTDIDGSISKQRVLVSGDNLALYTKQGSYEFSKPTPKYKLAGGGGGSLGDAVAPLMIMIAMKMEYVIKAPKAGTVTKVNSKLGDFVAKGKVLVAFAEDEE